MQNTDINNNGGFVAGTLVHTDKGLIPIQNLQVGDLVWTKSAKNNFDNEQETLQPILNIHTTPNVEIWKVEYLPNVDSEDEYLVFLGGDSYIWVNGDAEGYEGTKVGWTKATDDEMQTHSSVNLIGKKKGMISYSTITCQTTMNNVAYTIDSYNDPELLFDFNQNNQGYFIGDIFNKVFNTESFPTIAQDTIYVDSNDIVEDYNIYENDFKCDKYPTVVKFIQDYVNGNRVDELFTATIYQLEVAENHNYFVGNLGVLVGDMTILPTQ